MPMLSMKTKNPMKPTLETAEITDDAGLSSPNRPARETTSWLAWAKGGMRCQHRRKPAIAYVARQLISGVTRIRFSSSSVLRCLLASRIAFFVR